MRYHFANALCCGSRSTLPHVIYFKNTIDIFMFFLERLHQSQLIWRKFWIGYLFYYYKSVPIQAI